MPSVSFTLFAIFRLLLRKTYDFPHLCQLVDANHPLKKIAGDRLERFTQNEKAVFPKIRLFSLV